MFSSLLLAASLAFAANPALASLQVGAHTAAAANDTEIDADFDAALERYLELEARDTVEPDAAAQVRERLGQLADAGHGPALNLLAIMTEQGFGQPPNPPAALALYALAADAGSTDAMLNLAVRDIHSSDPDAIENGVASLEALARRDDVSDTISALTAGYRGATLLWGFRDARPGEETARSLLETGLAEDPGNRAFNHAMAELLTPTAHSPEALATVLDHYQRAGRAGDGRAAWQAAMMHLNGTGTDVDAEEAFGWVNLAALAGLDDGLISLAVMHAMGQGTPVDAPRARALYREAAMRGNAHAIRGLGLMLVFGEGGEADPAAGIALTRLAADAGDQVAASLLADLAPQLPDGPDWEQAVSNARAGFLAESGLSPTDLYGAQTDLPGAPAVTLGAD